MSFILPAHATDDYNTDQLSRFAANMDMSTEGNYRSTVCVHQSMDNDSMDCWSAGHDATTHAAVFYDDLISNMAVRIVLIALHVTASLVAVVGNAFVLFVIWRRRSLRRNAAILLIANLAVCDLSTGVSAVPVFLTRLSRFEAGSQQTQTDMTWPERRCQAEMFLQCLLAAVGLHTLVAISHERLLLIVYPLWARSACTTSRTRRLLVAVWVCAVACLLPMPLRYTVLQPTRMRGAVSAVLHCVVFAWSTADVAYLVGICVFYFVVPLLALSLAYARIFTALYRQSDVVDVGNSRMRARRRLARTMACVAVIFAVCWGPNFAGNVYVALGGELPNNGFFAFTVIEFLPLVSSSLNPFIYTISWRTFRSGLTSLASARRNFRRRRSSVFSSFSVREPPAQQPQQLHQHQLSPQLPHHQQQQEQQQQQHSMERQQHIQQEPGTPQTEQTRGRSWARRLGLSQRRSCSADGVTQAGTGEVRQHRHERRRTSSETHRHPR